MAKVNGFTPNSIQRLLDKKLRKLAIKKIYSSQISSSPSYWCKLFFCGPLTYKISKLFYSCKIRLAFYNNFCIKNFLCNGKDSVDSLSKSGVYQLSCGDCHCIFIGQSGRNFKLRAKELKNAYENSSQQWHFAKHLLDHDHFSDFKPKILRIAKKGRRLNILEKMEIILNNQNPNYILANKYIFSSSFLYSLRLYSVLPPPLSFVHLVNVFHESLSFFPHPVLMPFSLSLYVVFWYSFGHLKMMLKHRNM